MPVLIALMQWGDRWSTEDGGPVALLHRGCGARVRTELRCTEGHLVELDVLDLADVRQKPPARRRR